MKKVFFALVIVIAALSSCTKEDHTNKNVKCDATTLDVENVSADEFTFKASFKISGSGDIFCRYGVEAGEDKEKGFIATEFVNAQKAGDYNYSYKWVNNKQLLPTVPLYIFAPGTTVYYRAFIEVLGTDGGSKYYYGQTKSFTVPSAE